MSEIITGTAALAASACVAAGAVVVGGAYLAYKSLAWLSDEAAREIEKLEQTLTEPLAEATTAQARKEFSEKFQRALEAAAQNPLLRPHADSIAAIVGMRKSALGRFVVARDADAIVRPDLSQQHLARVLKNTEQHMTRTIATYVADAVIEVGRAAGFAAGSERQAGKNREAVVLKNGDGQALVAQVIQNGDGPVVKLDLTGFADGSCHPVMDDIVRRLSSKGIRLLDPKRRSHYRREGVLLPDALTRTTTASSMAPADAHELDDHQRRSRLSDRGLNRRAG